MRKSLALLLAVVLLSAFGCRDNTVTPVSEPPVAKLGVKLAPTGDAVLNLNFKANGAQQGVFECTWFAIHPCTDESVDGEGPCRVTYNMRANKHGERHTVSVRFPRNVGFDADGVRYQFALNASGQFDAPTAVATNGTLLFDMPVKARLLGPGIPAGLYDGVIRVGVFAGEPIGLQFTLTTGRCANG